MTKLEERTRHVYPHARAALRSWATHRRGPTMTGIGRGPAGHRAGIDDVLAVGRVLVALGLTLDPPCARLKQLLAWSMGLTKRRELESLAKRVERAMRAAAIVAPPTRVGPAWRDRWVDASGESHESTVLLEDRTIDLDSMSESCSAVSILD